MIRSWVLTKILLVNFKENLNIFLTSSQKNIIVNEEIESIDFIETHLSSHDSIYLVYSQFVQNQESNFTKRMDENSQQWNKTQIISSFRNPFYYNSKLNSCLMWIVVVALLSHYLWLVWALKLKFLGSQTNVLYLKWK